MRLSRFSVESFLPQSARKLHRGKFLCCVPENFRKRRTLWSREEGYQKFPSKYFCLRMPKTFVGEPFCALFQKRSGSEKGYG